MAEKLVILFLLLSIVTLSLQQTCCPADYSLHINDKLAICIRELTTMPSNYIAALEFCEDVTGGSLLKGDPRTEVDFILGSLTNGTVLPSWLGLDLNSLTWTIDGTTPSGYNWSDQTDTGFCVRINEDLTWSNVSCAATLNYICQVPVNCTDEMCLQAISLERCPCDVGFEKNADLICIDINECEVNSMLCTATLPMCVNTQGGYECVCAEDSDCTIDECTLDSDCTGTNMVCGTTIGNGQRRCQCAAGFTGATCSDINECQCGSVGDQCVEICQDGQCHLSKCAGENEVCQNSEGSYTCPCDTGFTRTFNNFCEDINECSQECVGERKTCVNTKGSYSCTCDMGYRLVDDVCEESCDGRCDSTSQICTEEPTPTCSCRVGFFLVGDNCLDVDECGDSTICANMANTLCVNTPLGSFTCQCRSGFQENMNGVCTDIDECSSNTHNCNSAADCTNTQGSHLCACTDNQILHNGVCTELRLFRVKIVATELNDTVTPYQDTMDVIYERHFCTIILDILQQTFSSLPVQCTRLRFESGSVRGYLQVGFASPSPSAISIENTLEGDVVSDVSGAIRLFSNDRLVSLSMINPTGSIDVEDIAQYNREPNACDPSPCQNNAPCIIDRAVFDVSCICIQGFSGEVCETSDTAVTEAPALTIPVNGDVSAGISNTVIIVIIVVIVVAFMLFLLVCCGCCFYFVSQRGFNGSPAGPHRSHPYGGPPVGRPGVAPIRSPRTISGYGGYYGANSVN